MTQNSFDNKIICESLNINAILNSRSGPCSTFEISVFNICGGENDIFTKTVVDWLLRVKKLSNINLLLCGAHKNVDSALTKIHKQESTEFSESQRKHSTATSAPKLFIKHQNNLPSLAQWKILQPDIIVIGLHCLGERWCLKNAPFEIFFPCNTHDRDTDGTFADMEDSIEENEYTSDDNQEEENDEQISHKKRKFTIENISLEQSGRPTMLRTEICRRIMLMHFLSLIAEHRPKIVFMENITQPSKQSERRRKEEQTWSQMVLIIQRFCAECSYRIRSMGLEMKEAQNDDFPSYDVWCNGVFFERIDNETNLSLLHHNMCLYDTPHNILGIQEATKWIFYDQMVLKKTQDFEALFDLNRDFIFSNVCAKQLYDGKKSKWQNKKRKKSVTLPLNYNFPYFYAKALAHYAVAQAVKMLE